MPRVSTPLRPSSGKPETFSFAATAVATPEGPARRLLGGAALVLLGTGAVLLAVVALATLLGYRALIVRSGSMSPAIETGDIVVTELVRPAEVAVSEVVTFRDPSRSLDLVTHRVMSVREEDGRFSFVTSGDANSGTEEWGIDREGTMGRLVLRVPGVGRPLSWLTTRWVRLGLVVGGSLLLGALLLRRIWAT